MGEDTQCNHVIVYTDIWKELINLDKWMDVFECEHRRSVPKTHMVTEFLTIPLVRRTFSALLLISCTKAASTNWRIILLVAETPTCHQGALSWALLHEHHVLKQRAVCRVPACSCPCLGQVGSQMAAGEKRWAERERWLQAAIRLRWGHLQKSGKMVTSTDPNHRWTEALKMSLRWKQRWPWQWRATPRWCWVRMVKCRGIAGSRSTAQHQCTSSGPEKPGREVLMIY